MNQLKYGYARWLNEFHRYFVPTTAATREWAARPLKTAMALAPGRMVDAAEDMMASWRKNDNTGKEGISSHLPIVITALAKDYVPTGGEFSRQLAREVDFTIPEDPKMRNFKLRQIQGDRRVQLLFVAPEEASARSMALQFCQWVTDHEWRRFTVPYEFAGFVHEWPVMLETPDVMPQSIDLGQKNITALVVDINLRETIPVFMAPKPGEPNDGQGDPSDPKDPAGYPRLIEVNVRNATLEVGGLLITGDKEEQIIMIDDSRPIAYAGTYKRIFKLDYSGQEGAAVITQHLTTNLSLDWPNRASLAYTATAV